MAKHRSPRNGDAPRHRDREDVGCAKAGWEAGYADGLRVRRDHAKPPPTPGVDETQAGGGGDDSSDSGQCPESLLMTSPETTTGTSVLRPSEARDATSNPTSIQQLTSWISLIRQHKGLHKLCQATVFVLEVAEERQQLRRSSAGPRWPDVGPTHPQIGRRASSTTSSLPSSLLRTKMICRSWSPHRTKRCLWLIIIIIQSQIHDFPKEGALFVWSAK